MTNRDDERHDRLVARLRDDARTWDAAPSAASHARLHAAIDTWRPAPTRRRLWIAAAAAAVLGLTGWAWTRPRPAPAPQRTTLHLDAALEPLQRELAAVSSDGRAVLDAVWEGVRRPLLCMTGR